MGKIRILVVDDEAEIRDILEQALTLAGHQVTVADGGLKAIKLCRTFLPHIVLLDVMMPDLSGIETLQRIREQDREVKVVMVSGMHDLQTAKEAIALGALDYITKPFDLRDLDEYIRSQAANMV